jgi:hypothetical protein
MSGARQVSGSSRQDALLFREIGDRFRAAALDLASVGDRRSHSLLTMRANFC